MATAVLTAAPPQPLTEDAIERVGFVLGMMRRTGTAYLYGLLLLHPDAARVRDKVWEDFLLAHARHLERYVRALHHEWNPEWGIDASDLRDLRRSLGLGLAHYVRGGKRAPLALAKTPSIVNLPLFFDYFPKGKAVVLVRDGRAVVASGVKSFGWNRDEAIRTWARAAQAVIDFDEANAERRGTDYLVVRYEELFTRTRETLSQVLALMGLDPVRYPWEEAERLPVRGSSNLARDNGKVHWQPVKRTGDFKPLARFADWSPAEHARFNWLAGDLLERLGYEPVVPDGADLRTTALWNRALDTVDWSGRARAAVRRVAGRYL